MRSAPQMIKCHRHSEKMTQTEIALNLDCSSQFFNAIEMGKSLLPPRLFHPLCSLLKISEHLLISAMVSDFRERLLHDIHSTTHR